MKELIEAAWADRDLLKEDKYSDAVRQVIEPEQVRWVPSDYFRLPQTEACTP